MNPYKITIVFILILLFGIGSNAKNKTSITNVKAKLALRIKFDKRPDIYNNFGIIDSNTFLFVDKCIRIYKNNYPTKIIDLEHKLQYTDYFDYNYLDSLITIKMQDTLYLINLNGDLKESIVLDYGNTKIFKHYFVTHSDRSIDIYNNKLKSHCSVSDTITDTNVQLNIYPIPSIVTENNELTFYINNTLYEFDLENCFLKKTKKLNADNIYTYFGKSNIYHLFQEYIENRKDVFISLADENLNIVNKIKFKNLTRNLLYGFDEGELEGDAIEYQWLGGVFIKYESKLNSLFFFLNTWQGIEVYKYYLN